jgi:hypothetical protein
LSFENGGLVIKLFNPLKLELQKVWFSVASGIQMVGTQGPILSTTDFLP